ncbi:GIY-YIG nuclease family protein [Clostridium sp. C8]|uniref:GIY-YIG nuclease family protein n=1 Tax=Clostridium sp. C8 TaxID=1667357 RepID=UPI000A7EFEF0|nr:GIY-YIG nuclease family protein [Clostridium sp. C8]
MFKLIKELFSLKKTIEQKNEELKSLNRDIEKIELEKNEKIKSLDVEVNKEVIKLKETREEEIDKLVKKIKKIEEDIENKANLVEEIEGYKTEIDKLNKSVKRESKKVESLKYQYESIKYIVNKYEETDILNKEIIETLNEQTSFEPTVEIKLHCLDIKELRKEFNNNKKEIKKVLERYEGRYTTKANLAIYKLMVIALEAELQNILYNLKYNKLETSINSVKEVTQKYLSIANTGNQSIANTLMKFINEIECLFIKAIEIEYEYYVKKEKEKQEQAALREQMKLEAEERKELEKQKKKMEEEESKYKNEIDNVKELLANTEDIKKIEKLNEKINELMNKLKAVDEKKEEIAKRQNGKAGYVYVISNLGSFGENMFKVGMTRRLEPMDRVKELGDASVPFEFDVHSFIFSEDAVELEQKMHDRLKNTRVNKINLRKEFFNVSIDDLEELVQDIDPAAEFNKTMIAEQYRQGLALKELEEVVI